MFEEQVKQTVRSGLARLRGSPGNVTRDFYDHLFKAAPSVRPLFRDDVDVQADKLLDMLVVLVQSLDHLQELVTEIESLGVRHAAYGVKEEHYILVARVLMVTLRDHISNWSDQDENAWGMLLDYVADLMITGAREANGAAA